MTNRERLLAVIRGEIPDCVPVAPDFSNMIPARLTGKPFWDLYLYNDPPIWEAYIACAKHFDIDSVMDGYCPLVIPDENAKPGGGPPWERFIIHKDSERIIVRDSYKEDGKRVWHPLVHVYYVADPPTHNIPVERINLPPVPERFEPLQGVKPIDLGPENFKRAKNLMGDQGLVGAFIASTCAFNSEASILSYFDNPDKHEEWAAKRVEAAEKSFHKVMALPEDSRPDFLCVGGSGTLVFQTVEMFRKIALPAVKRVIGLATAAGMPTQIHSCGPEKELVKIMAEETTLTIIDPLEIPPMGDCDLAELKRRYGDKIVLKGNLHTTDVMLRGSVDVVIAASKKAIDDGAAGGRFILSTGDQCGRDTPDENLRAMIETARTYGRY